MLQLTTLPAPIPAWGDDLRHGDVVLFRFPCAEEHPVEAPKRRTHISTPEETALAGVHKPTRFVCSRRVWVTLDHPGWDADPAHPSPIIGYLAPAASRKMDAIRARMLAMLWRIARRSIVARTFG
ncbi:MAG: hypothetical protein U1E34_13965 [Amaricoccus sp.]